MIKRMMIRATVAAAMLTLAAGPAQAEDGPAFVIYFYSDASHTNQVGFADAHCYPGPHAQMMWGHSTAYRDEVFIGDCIDGELYYW